jgi:hypothetical protein
MCAAVAGGRLSSCSYLLLLLLLLLLLSASSSVAAAACKGKRLHFISTQRSSCKHTRNRSRSICFPTRSDLSAGGANSDRNSVMRRWRRWRRPSNTSSSTNGGENARCVSFLTYEGDGGRGIIVMLTTRSPTPEYEMIVFCALLLAPPPPAAACTA